MTDQALAQAHRERDRQLRRGISTSLLARAFALAGPLILVPLTLGYLGKETYAIWMSAASLTAMFVFADLGLGQGLMTVLTPLVVRGEIHKARAAISATYTSLVVVALATSAGIVAVGQLVDLAAALGAEHPGTDDRAIATACLLMFAVNVPLSLIVRVQYAVQEVGSANLWQAGGAVASLGLASMSVLLDLGPVLVVLSALSGPLLANLLDSLWFYARRRDLAPRPALGALRRELPALGALGGGFLTLNIVMAVASNLDIIIVSHFEDAAFVVGFAIVVRLFAQVGSLVSLVNVPLWPANAEAITRGDIAWVTRTTRKMTVYSLLAVALVALPTVIAGDAIFDIWTGADLQISRVLLMGAGAWWLLLAGLSPRFMVQNSVGVLRPQLLGWGCFLLLSVPAKLWIVTSGQAEWVPLVGATVGLVTLLPGCVVGYYAALRAEVDRKDVSS